MTPAGALAITGGIFFFVSLWGSILLESEDIGPRWMLPLMGALAVIGTGMVIAAVWWAAFS